MPSKQRILVLAHPDCVPPDTIEGLVRQRYGRRSRRNSMSARPCATWATMCASSASRPTWAASCAMPWPNTRPQIVFNLLEELAGVGVYDSHVAAYLEANRQPYTGCNPRGLMLAHNKAVSKMICRYHRIPVPRFHVFPIGPRKTRRPKHLPYPLIVKSLTEEGSVGISEASVVTTDEQLAAARRLHPPQLATDAIAEQYVDGRELYIGVIGNQRLDTFPIWEMTFDGLRDGAPRIATGKIKWDETTRRRSSSTPAPPRTCPRGWNRRCPSSPSVPTARCSCPATPALDFRLDDRWQGLPPRSQPQPPARLRRGLRRVRRDRRASPTTSSSPASSTSASATGWSGRCDVGCARNAGRCASPRAIQQRAPARWVNRVAYRRRRPRADPYAYNPAYDPRVRPQYSIIIPAYNEQDQLARTLPLIRDGDGGGPLSTGRADRRRQQLDRRHRRRSHNARRDGCLRAGKPDRQSTQRRGPLPRIRQVRCIFVDADTTPDGELIEQAVALMLEDKAIGGGGIVEMDTPGAVDRPAGAGVLEHRVARVPALGRVLLLLPARGVRGSAGGFPETVYASEEIWLGRRLRKLGRQRATR